MRVEESASPTVRQRFLLVLLVAALGLNLRATLGTVPALLDRIRSDVELSGSAAGLLTSTAVVAMGLGAPLGPALSARIGVQHAVTACLGALSAGGLLRICGELPGVLHLAALVSGLGMGAASSLVPGLVARSLPRQAGAVTGAYASCMAIGVGVAAFLSVPLADALGSWQRSLAVWGAVAAATLVAWIAVASRLAPAFGLGRPVRAAAGSARGLPWRSRTAWLVTLMVATPMALGFAGVAWIDPVFRERGADPATAAGMFLLFQGVQLAAMMVMPAVSDARGDRRPMLAVALVIASCGAAGVTLEPAAVAISAVALFGFGIGGATALALALVGDCAATATDSARLGAMALLVGFTVGAAGPVALGALHDVTGSYAPGFAGLALLGTVTLSQARRLRPGRVV